MRLLLPELKSVSVPREPPENFSEKFNREDQKRKRKRIEEFFQKQRCRPENRSAEIDKENLYDGDRTHDEKEGTVSPETGKEIHPVGAAIETVCDRGENEKGKKRGQKAEIVLAVPEMRGYGRRLQKPK